MTLCTEGHREACWGATTPASSCTCNCGGVNHGIAAGEIIEQEDLFMEIDLQNLESYRTIDAFYDQYEPARLSGESDYGVWWRDDDGGIWRVTYVHATGHVYAIRSSGTISGRIRIGGQEAVVVSTGRDEGPVVVLGKLAPKPELDDPDHEDWLNADPAEPVLKGWGERCGQQGSLAWVFGRVREAAGGVAT